MTLMRMTLQEILQNFQMEVDETPHVYFDPPETVKMSYPCFIYHFEGYEQLNGNDERYLESERYSVRYVTKTADALLPKLIRELPRVSFERHYTAENLHHYMFTFRSMPVKRTQEKDLRKIAASFLGGNNEQDYLG